MSAFGSLISEGLSGMTIVQHAAGDTAYHLQMLKNQGVVSFQMVVGQVVHFNNFVEWDHIIPGVITWLAQCEHF